MTWCYLWGYLVYVQAFHTQLGLALVGGELNGWVPFEELHYEDVLVRNALHVGLLQLYLTELELEFE